MSSSRVEKKRVFELKEKKRRLILQDFDSDDSPPSPPRKKPAHDGEQNGIRSVVVAAVVVFQEEMTVSPALIRNGSSASAASICALEEAVRLEELKVEDKKSMEAGGKMREVFEEVKAEKRDGLICSGRAWVTCENAQGNSAPRKSSSSILLKWRLCLYFLMVVRKDLKV